MADIGRSSKHSMLPTRQTLGLSRQAVVDPFQTFESLFMIGLSLLDGAPEVYMVDVMTGTARQAG